MTEEKKIEEQQEEIKVEEPLSAEEKTEITDQTEEKPLDKMTTPELREIARQIPGVEGTSAMKKEELLEIIKKDRGIEDEKPGKKKKKGKVAKEINVKDLKQEIIQLKEKKQEMRREKDRKQIGVLRRRINRLKKRTRNIVKG